jgi:hypothetical protein
MTFAEHKIIPDVIPRLYFKTGYSHQIYQMGWFPGWIYFNHFNFKMHVEHHDTRKSSNILTQSRCMVSQKRISCIWCLTVNSSSLWVEQTRKGVSVCDKIFWLHQDGFSETNFLHVMSKQFVSLSRTN